ncbi:MAG: carbon-nitrogen hydrolase family protein [Clostridiales bacterium]|nr:carbon-nitrogen hydrolase family protein [Clostridiales bacterium]
MKVAAIQFAGIPATPEANRQKAAALINEAADKGARLLVLPEYWPAGFNPLQVPDFAETMRDATVSLLRRLAKERQVFIVSGSLAEKRDGRLYNTTAAISETGEIAAKYRKTHLCPLKEEEIFFPGDEWTITEYSGLRVGIISCYDVYFPEFTRNLALRGAQLLAMPAMVEKTAEEVRLLARARALENSCFVIMANQALNAAAGLSLIISPDGRVLAEAGSKDEVLLAELDMHSLASVRGERNILNNRRNILDEIDNSQL